MLTYVVGSLFESPAHTLVNTVNIEGVMGKGVAKQFKTIYPEMFGEYQRLCEREQFTIGQLWLYKTSNKWVLNFPTKTTWRKPSKVEYVERGLKNFAGKFADLGITSVSFPLLGCGNGELDWERQVKPLMEEYLSELPIQVYIHTYQTDPFAEPEHRNIRQIKRWLRSEPNSLPFAEVWQDLKATLADAPILTTPDTGLQFEAYLLEDAAPGVLIVARSEPQMITYESLQSVWEVIRAGRFAAVETLAPHLGDTVPYLSSLFSRLEYVKLTRFGSEYERDPSAYGIGLQLNPAPRSTRFPTIRQLSLV